MLIRFEQNGDPWHDWGLCELYDLLKIRCEWTNEAEVIISPPDAAGFTFQAKLSPEQFGAILHSVMSSSYRWKKLYPRFVEGRMIPRCKPSIDEYGRRIPGEKYDPKLTQDEWDACGLKGKPPSLARNKCQRIASVPMTPGKLAELLNLQMEKEAIGVIATEAAKGNTADITQSANPVSAKHHSNGKTRGISGSNSARADTALYLLTCFATSLSAKKPFDKNEDDCIVFLPDNVPFLRSIKLWNRLVKILIHPDEGTMYRNLPIEGDGEEAQLLILLHSLQTSLALHEEGGLFYEDIISLNNWLAVHFSSGANVNVGSIHRIEIPSSIFRLIDNIECPHYWTDKRNITFVKDCLTGIRINNVPIQSRFARSLFMANRLDAWKALCTTAFFIYKNVDQANKSNRSSVTLLPYFYQHFAKELLNMNEELLTSCRKIGELIGSAFPRDVTLISRLHNATSPDDLRSNLNTVVFRLFKASTNDNKDNALWHISSSQFQSVLDTVNDDNWQTASQTISIFASLTAFNKNLNSDVNKEGDKK